MKKILTVGDSWTYGEGSSDPTTKSWPMQLSKKYSVDVKNLGECGSSNQRAVRKAIDELTLNPSYDCVIWPIGPAPRKEIMSVGKWKQAWPTTTALFNKVDNTDLDKFFLNHWHPWNDVVETIYLVYTFISFLKFINVKFYISSLSFFSEQYKNEFHGIQNYKHDYKFAEVKLPINDLMVTNEEMHLTVTVMQKMLSTINSIQSDVFNPVTQDYLELSQTKLKYGYDKINGHPCDVGYAALADYYAKKINLI